VCVRARTRAVESDFPVVKSDRPITYNLAPRLLYLGTSLLLLLIVCGSDFYDGVYFSVVWCSIYLPQNRSSTNAIIIGRSHYLHKKSRSV
jgi:hypothetical protein